jgi:two-component system cell cycle response regulator DivK
MTIRVVIADDHAVVRQGLEQLISTTDDIEFAGSAANGEEAVALAARERPDVILMDLSMPKLDGWEATRRLKRDPRTRHIPVIAFTGHVLKAYLEQAREAGCDAVMTKPMQPRELEAAVRKLLGRDPASRSEPRGRA